MSISPLLALGGMLSASELLPRIGEGFSSLFGGAANAGPAGVERGANEEAAPASDTERLEQRLAELIRRRLTAAGLSSEGSLTFEVDAVGTLQGVDGGAGAAIDELLNSDPEIRTAALDLIDQVSDSRWRQGDDTATLHRITVE